MEKMKDYTKNYISDLPSESQKKVIDCLEKIHLLKKNNGKEGEAAIILAVIEILSER